MIKLKCLRKCDLLACFSRNNLLLKLRSRRVSNDVMGRDTEPSLTDGLHCPQRKVDAELWWSQAEGLSSVCSGDSLAFTVVLVNQTLAVNLIRNRFWSPVCLYSCRPPPHCHMKFKALATMLKFKEKQTVHKKFICHRYVSCLPGHKHTRNT